MRGASGEFQDLFPVKFTANYEKESYKIGVYVGNIFGIGFCNYRIFAYSYV